MHAIELNICFHYKAYMSMLVSNYSGLTVFTHSDCHQCFLLIENQYREGTICPLVEHQSILWISDFICFSPI